MATIAGSQFEAFAGNPFGTETVNLAFTTNGTTDTNSNPLLSDTVPGDFNLEIFIGTVANAPAIASGYDGLAVLAPSGST